MSLPAGAAAQAGSLPGAAREPEGPPPPRLRQTLDILPTTPDPDGAPAWLLHDRTANRYFRVGAVELDLLALVDGRSAEALCAAAWTRFHRRVTVEEVEDLFDFLRTNNLAVTDAEQHRRHAQTRAARPKLFSRLLHGYISFRVPLARPDRFLTAALPWVTWLGSRGMALVLTLLAVAGLYLVTRQWEVFLATAVSFVSLEGLAAYTVAVVAVKVCHELGHAFAAKARGLRVPTMGVAFIVFWPVAYTDTTDAWRLPRRRDRLAVGAGGVAVELGIAAVCLFLWNVVPDGPARAVLFLLATTSWVLSLLVNLNPLMRFDGYFLFSDLVGVANLEHKAHADAKYWLRRLLFGWDTPLRAEAPQVRYALFGLTIWLYRLSLFLGIALAVYHLFFKALGIILFAVEILYFILGPMWREVREWLRRREDIRLNRATLRLLLILAVLVLLVAVPWRTSVVAPALVEAETARLYMPEAARIKEVLVRDGAVVAAGQPLVVLDSPDLEHEIAQAVRRHDGLILERASLGVDELRRERAAVVVAQAQSERRRIEGLRARLDRLVLRAPHAGTVRGLRPDLAPGGWMADAVALLEVVATETPYHLTAYVPEQDIDRLSPGAAVRFQPEDGLRAALDGRIIAVDLTPLTEAPDLLASSYHGPIDVRVDAEGRRVPLQALYRVTATVTVDAPPGTILRGRATLAAEARSIGRTLWRRLVSLVQRESGL